MKKKKKKKANTILAKKRYIEIISMTICWHNNFLLELHPEDRLQRPCHSREVYKRTKAASEVWQARLERVGHTLPPQNIFQSPRMTSMYMHVYMRSSNDISGRSPKPRLYSLEEAGQPDLAENVAALPSHLSPPQWFSQYRSICLGEGPTPHTMSAPIGRGCDGCRAQKKKVTLFTLRSCHANRRGSVTKSVQCADDVVV